MVDQGRTRVEVLGPLRVLDDGGHDRTPDGVLARRLLALLVLHRGRVVSTDAVIDVLWPSALPRDPAGAVQNHLFRLRRGLPPGLIDSVGDGYRLEPGRLDVDVDTVGAAVGRGSAIDDAALAALDAVLARWHGPAFPELADVDDARVEADRLEELRFRAREVHAEGRLRRGDADGVIAVLAALADDAPLRERPHALLMTALTSAGRQAEALRVYDGLRRRLGDELGIEPSPLLTAQHAAILVARDGPSTALGPTIAPAPLPVPPTSLVGRASLAVELTELTELTGGARVVSLVGPGGVGKTRLLIALGHRLRAEQPARPVVLCELAGVDRVAAAAAVAAALGIDSRPGVPLAERMASVVGASEVVVLLDNCEHVLDPVAELVEHLVARCPALTVVATSRERLRVPGEQVRAVPPLPVDDVGSDGVRLFVERARALVPAFAPQGGDLACVAEVVRRLDGLPLAIELAAARLHTHDLREVAAGLDHRFALLTSGSRTSSRHGSLGATVAWSFGLLEEPLQVLFTTLSVFSGPFTAADAAAVAAVDEADVAAALVQLVERSLAMRTPDRRFVLLETLRAFGTEQLASQGRDDLVRERHAHHLVRWVELARGQLLAPGPSAITTFDGAITELRNALDWLVAHGQVVEAGRIVTGLFHYCFLRLRPDVLAWAEVVATADPDDRSPVAAAYAAWMAGDTAATGARTARALAIAERSGADPPAVVLMARGSYELFEGRLATSAAWYRRSVDLASGDHGAWMVAASSELLALGYAGDPEAAARAAALLGVIADDGSPYAAFAWYCAGEALLDIDPGQAEVRLTRAIVLADATGASFVLGLAGEASRASLDARLGDPAEAAQRYRELIAHWRRAGMWSTQWTMLRSIAALLARLARHHDAAVLVGAVQATTAGRRIFGADEVALRELARHLVDTLGAPAFEQARAAGAVLDGDAAVEHALRAL